MTTWDHWKGRTLWWQVQSDQFCHLPGRRWDPAFPGQHTLHLDSRFVTPSILRTFSPKLYMCHREMQLLFFRASRSQGHEGALREGGWTQRDQRDRVLAADPGKEVGKQVKQYDVLKEVVMVRGPPFVPIQHGPRLALHHHGSQQHQVGVLQLTEETSTRQRESISITMSCYPQPPSASETLGVTAICTGHEEKAGSLHRGGEKQEG